MLNRNHLVLLRFSAFERVIKPNCSMVSKVRSIRRLRLTCMAVTLPNLTKASDQHAVLATNAYPALWGSRLE